MKKILIVDDSEMARKSMCFSLSSKRYNVLEAVSGRDAVAKLKENPDIGLVITDLNMPEMNGLELIAHIRSNHKPADIPVYVITTENKTGDDVMKKGATGYIVKSSKTSEELHRIVEKHMV
ncbi:MAG: response regulator [Spirochaetales bacterium]|nr:response regulator [Spirochaetales bacterium]